MNRRFPFHFDSQSFFVFLQPTLAASAGQTMGFRLFVCLCWLSCWSSVHFSISKITKMHPPNLLSVIIFFSIFFPFFFFAETSTTHQTGSLICQAVRLLNCQHASPNSEHSSHDSSWWLCRAHIPSTRAATSCSYLTDRGASGADVHTLVCPVAAAAISHWTSTPKARVRRFTMRRQELKRWRLSEIGEEKETGVLRNIKNLCAGGKS